MRSRGCRRTTTSIWVRTRERADARFEFRGSKFDVRGSTVRSRLRLANIELRTSHLEPRTFEPGRDEGRLAGTEVAQRGDRGSLNWRRVCVRDRKRVV